MTPFNLLVVDAVSLDFIPNPSESPRFPGNGFFHPGDMVRVKCQYNAAECESRNHTHLVIVPEGKLRLTDAGRGKCWTEVKIENITLVEGKEFIRCSDTEDQTQVRRRSIRVGCE